MANALTELYRHNLWANLRLVDYVAGLDERYLTVSVPGTYGNVGDTLLHIANLEERYARGLRGESIAELPYQDNGFPGFDTLRERFRRSGESLIEIADQVQPGDTFPAVWQGVTHQMPVTDPLIQAINHATEHRAHIVTTLSQHGVEPVVLDAWTFAGETRAG